MKTTCTSGLSQTYCVSITITNYNGHCCHYVLTLVLWVVTTDILLTNDQWGLTEGSNTHLASSTLLVRALLQRPSPCHMLRSDGNPGGETQILISDKSYFYVVNNQIPKSHHDGPMAPTWGAEVLMSRTIQQPLGPLFGLARSVTVRWMASTKQNRLLSCCALNNF